MKKNVPRSLKGKGEIEEAIFSSWAGLLIWLKSTAELETVNNNIQPKTHGWSKVSLKWSV